MSARRPGNDIRYPIRSRGPLEPVAEVDIEVDEDTDAEAEIIPQEPADNINVEQHYARHTYGMAINIHKAVKPFSGDLDEDADSFIDQFQSYVAFTKTDKDIQPHLFSMCLENQSSARQWFNCLHEDIKKDIDVMIQNFLSRFSLPPNVTWVAYQELHGMTQGYMQPVTKYITSVRCKARQAKVDDDQVFNILMGGLKPDIRTPVIQSDPKTLDEITRSAEIAERSLMANKNVLPQSETLESKPKELKQDQPKNPEMLEQILSAISTMTTKLEVNVLSSNKSQCCHANAPNTGNKTTHRQYTQYNGRPNQSQPYRQAPQANSPRCWSCGRSDHKQQNCKIFLEKWTCHKCSGLGHLANVCGNNKKRTP